MPNCYLTTQILSDTNPIDWIIAIYKILELLVKHNYVQYCQSVLERIKMLRNAHITPHRKL